MRESSLRWALGLGGIAAFIGVLAAFAGNRVVPNSGNVDINSAVLLLLVAGLFALLALGIALGLAYYAGLRAEQDRPRATVAVDPDLDPAAARRDSALAGLIVMALYWVFTTLYGLLFGPHTNTAGTSASSLLIQRIVIGIVFLLLGFGLGALGSRAPAARRLLDEIASAPPTPPVPAAEFERTTLAAADPTAPATPGHAKGSNANDGNAPGGTPATPPSDTPAGLPPA